MFVCVKSWRFLMLEWSTGTLLRVKIQRMMKQLQKIFEGLLWNSRLLVFIAVIGSLLSALAIFYMTTLIVRFFEFAIEMELSSALGMLQFAVGIAFLGLALYLSHLGDNKH